MPPKTKITVRMVPADQVPHNYNPMIQEYIERNPKTLCLQMMEVARVEPEEATREQINRFIKTYIRSYINRPRDPNALPPLLIFSWGRQIQSHGVHEPHPLQNSGYCLLLCHILHRRYHHPSSSSAHAFPFLAATTTPPPSTSRKLPPPPPPSQKSPSPPSSPQPTTTTSFP